MKFILRRNSIFAIFYLMESLKRAASVLQQAEANLRALVSEAATSGDYASVVQIAAWARTISELVHAAPGSRELSSGASLPQPKATEVRTAPRNKPRRASEEYPRFS